MLNLSYAELELDHGYIRAVTPYYSIYDITARTNDGWQKVLSDRSPQATALKSCWTPKGAGYQVCGRADRRYELRGFMIRCRRST